MCVLLICRNPLPDIDLIVLHNRDEFTSRPFESARLRHFHHQSGIYGLDLEAQGTWLAVTSDGKFSAVLNIRSNPTREKKPKSRGDLPLDLLSNRVKIDEIETDNYGPFNLVYGSSHRPLEVFSSTTKSYLKRDDQMLALSNHSHIERWKKSAAIQKLFQSQALGKSASIATLVDQSFKILENTEKLADHELPLTGFSVEIERELSSQFVNISKTGYQTVVSTVIVMPGNKKPIVFEKNQLKPDKGVLEVSF